jgi:hypothetical protein
MYRPVSVSAQDDEAGKQPLGLGQIVRRKICEIEWTGHEMEKKKTEQRIVNQQPTQQHHHHQLVDWSAAEWAAHAVQERKSPCSVPPLQQPD